MGVLEFHVFTTQEGVLELHVFTTQKKEFHIKISPQKPGFNSQTGYSYFY